MSTPRIDAVLDRFHKALDKEDFAQKNGEATASSSDVTLHSDVNPGDELIEDEVRIDNQQSFDGPIV